MLAKYRHALPQLGDALFLTDGGLETTLIFHEGIELPLFASFDLMRTAEGRAALERYFARYVALAKAEGRGLVLESATWRSPAVAVRPVGATGGVVSAGAGAVPPRSYAPRSHPAPAGRAFPSRSLVTSLRAVPRSSAGEPDCRW